MFNLAIISLTLAASALADVFITSPTASTTFPAGQPATVSWQDSGSSPSLGQFGNATFAIYAGNAIEQTMLQMIATNVNVSAVPSVTFTPDATIGPNGREYFIRVTSATLMNPSAPQYPEEAFSALFSLSGMTGSFNSTIQAEINGQSTAPIGGTSAASSGTPQTSTMSGMQTMPSMSGMSSRTMSSTASAATASTTARSGNGAGKPVVATGLVALLATLVGASLF